MNTVTTSTANPPRLIILMGIPAAGKTTFYTRMFAPQGIRHINLDTLRKRHREMLLVQQYISERVSFAVDNTNTLPLERERYIIPATTAGYRIEGYLLRSCVADSIRDNAARERHVPVHAIQDMFDRLVLPRYAEGFHELYYVKRRIGGYDITPWIEFPKS